MKEQDYQQELKELREQVKGLTKQLDKVGHRAGREVARKSEDYLHEAQDYYDQLSGNAREKWSEVSSQAKDMGKKADKYAHENPWQAVGIAAAAGFLAAMLAGGARRRD